MWGKLPKRNRLGWQDTKLHVEDNCGKEVVSKAWFSRPGDLRGRRQQWEQGEICEEVEVEVEVGLAVL